MFAEQFANVRTKSPLIHNITNYVTVNDCANMVLACGASPIMADDAAEVEDITTICGGLNINIGTLNSRTIESMLKAGKKANALGHPVVLDPVGAGASALRTETAYRLLDEVRFTVIRGNISEVKTLASGAGTTKGVDADVADRVTEENLDGAVAFAKAFAAKTGAVVAITGAIDIVADGAKAYCIRNGHPMMSAITGTGCQLSALTAAFITANPGQPLKSLAKVASGGELSRVALAIKTVLLNASGVPTMVFDEIDTGVGGVTAQKMAEKIAVIAKVGQVLCITHLPQIASFADRHLLIRKESTGGRTSTGLTVLDEEGRIQELMRMTVGDNVSEVAYANAKELLAAAAKNKQAR